MILPVHKNAKSRMHSNDAQGTRCNEQGLYIFKCKTVIAEFVACQHPQRASACIDSLRRGALHLLCCSLVCFNFGAPCACGCCQLQRDRDLCSADSSRRRLRSILAACTFAHSALLSSRFSQSGMACQQQLTLADFDLCGMSLLQLLQ